MANVDRRYETRLRVNTGNIWTVAATDETASFSNGVTVQRTRLNLFVNTANTWNNRVETAVDETVDTGLITYSCHCGSVCSGNCVSQSKDAGSYGCNDACTSSCGSGCTGYCSDKCNMACQSGDTFVGGPNCTSGSCSDFCAANCHSGCRGHCDTTCKDGCGNGCNNGCEGDCYNSCRSCSNRCNTTCSSQSTSLTKITSNITYYTPNLNFNIGGTWYT